jgi:hypothetical protein
MIGLMYKKQGRTTVRAGSAQEVSMTIAVKQMVRVQPGGLVQVRAPELQPGDMAEVIVLVEKVSAESRAELARRWEALFKEIQALPQAQAITEEEIAAEIAAYRAGK